MPITVTPFLRNALLLDAVASGTTALLVIAGAGMLEPLLGLPSQFMTWAGIALVPFIVMLVVVARRQTTSRMVLVDIIAINALWVVGSFAVLIFAPFEPSLLGILFVTAQALAVALFAELQFIGLRRSAVAA